VLSTARKLNEIQVIDEPLDEIGGLEATVRPLTKPELVTAAEQARSVVAIAAAADDAALEPGREDDYGIGAGAETERDRRTGS
jgi:hypothetical protein